MNKWYGEICFGYTEETSRGIYEKVETRRNYYGNLKRDTKMSYSVGTEVNPNIKFNNIISVISDEYLNNHLIDIKYIDFYGSKWKVASFELAHPRVNLTLGDLYK